ncbi:MAG: hypothetical protein JSV49_08260 [Thermoplasmata archaeon]|nr:MAG: hypothetical protein JSV49_08260 [Thermoplasmata archaeon]
MSPIIDHARSDPTSSFEYIIIGPESFEAESIPLLEWKTKKGVPALFKSLESINSEFAAAGGDELYKIRQFLIDTYQSNPALKWVLLMGDSDVFPIRELYAGAQKYNMLQFYCSDHYLASLDGSWDSNDNGIYGEQLEDEDWDSELFVGRLPVSTPTDVKVAVDKILAYERSPPEGDWFQTALIMGSLMDAPNVEDDPDTLPPEDEGYNDYKDNAYEVKKKSLEFFPSYYNITELYDYDRIPSGEYNLENDTLTRENAVAEFNKGYALINFAGQARFNGDSLMQYEWADGTGTYQDHRLFAWRDLFRYEDGQQANNGLMLPFMMMPTCDAANFTEDDDTNLEVLFNTHAGGIIGMISSTGVSHRGESIDGNSYGNWWEDQQFWKIFFQQEFYQPGEALAVLKSSFADNILAAADTNPMIKREAVKGNLEGLILMGDPEIPLWTKIPRNVEVAIQNLTTGSVTVDITVTDEDSGSPVENALVALLNDQLYLYGTTDYNGNIRFDTEIITSAQINITVTAHNYLPEELQQVIPRAKPVITQINDITMDEDSALLDYVKLSDIVTDADTPFDELTIVVMADASEVGIVIDSGKAIDIVPEPDWYGTSIATLSVEDDIHSVTMDFTITVQPVNDPPVIHDVPEDLQVWEDRGLFIYENLSASDPDSVGLKFSDNTELFEINYSTGKISFVPTHTSVGAHQVCVYVTDGVVTSTACFNITVHEMPDAPTITPIDTLGAKVGEKFEYDVVAFDDDGDELTYSVKPDWVKIDPDTGKISFTPDSDKTGEHEVTVYVSDGKHTTAETFTLEVRSGTDYKFIAMALIYLVAGLIIIMGFLYKRYNIKKKEEPEKGEGKKEFSEDKKVENTDKNDKTTKSGKDKRVKKTVEKRGKK